jgi:hypothetical protein
MHYSKERRPLLVGLPPNPRRAHEDITTRHLPIPYVKEEGVEERDAGVRIKEERDENVKIKKEEGGGGVMIKEEVVGPSRSRRKRTNCVLRGRDNPMTSDFVPLCAMFQRIEMFNSRYHAAS